MNIISETLCKTCFFFLLVVAVVGMVIAAANRKELSTTTRRERTKQKVIEAYNLWLQDIQDSSNEQGFGYPEETAGGVASRNRSFESNGVVPSDRIFNGTNAQRHEFGYYARVFYVLDDGFIGLVCGGSLVSLDFVLTAAHCLWDFNTNDVVVEEVGVIIAHFCDEIFTTGRNCGQRHDVILATEVIWDDRWNPQGGSLLHDLALLRLEEPSRAGYSPIQPDDGSISDSLSDGEIVTIIGFGTINGQRAVPPFLQTVDLPVISTDECEARWKEDMRNATICIDSTSGSVCKGDSGGPMIVKRNGIDIVIGVVSFGQAPAFDTITGEVILFSCGGLKSISGTPDVMARVSAGMDWIQQEVCWEARLAAERPSWCSSTNRATKSPVVPPSRPTSPPFPANVTNPPAVPGYGIIPPSRREHPVSPRSSVPTASPTANDAATLSATPSTPTNDTSVTMPPAYNNTAIPTFYDPTSTPFYNLTAVPTALDHTSVPTSSRPSSLEDVPTRSPSMPLPKDRPTGHPGAIHPPPPASKGESSPPVSILRTDKPTEHIEPTTSPDKAGSCPESGTFKFRKKTRKCAWLRKKNLDGKLRICSKKGKQKAKRKCPKSCSGTC